MRGVERVSYQQVYDLIFRARNAKLGYVCYELSFLDWIKAGIAFNTRGCELGTRKIAMFAELYHILEKCVIGGADALVPYRNRMSDALLYYYEDIYAVYQDHLTSKQLEVRTKDLRSVPTFGDLLILPSFRNLPWMEEVFEKRCESIHDYECKNKRAFLNDVSSPYLDRSSFLAKSMSMMYDYGMGRLGYGVLLEVEQWDETAQTK